MRVIPANNKKGIVHYWAGRNPGCVGHMWSLFVKDGRLSVKPIDFYDWIPFCIDNGRFICWDKGIDWSEEAFLQLCAYARLRRDLCLFVTVPDVPRDNDATISEWLKWEPVLRAFHLPLAFVVQDGARVQDIPDSADWIFVAGSDEWRFAHLRDFVSMGKPVHVGRVNHFKRLWQCHDAGVASCDGTGWFRGDFAQTKVLIDYWKFLVGESIHPVHWQLDLFAS